MKKLVFLLCAVFVALFMSSCHKDKKDTPKSDVETSLNFDSILVNDYNKVCGLTTDSDVVFFEAEVTFDTTLDADTVKPVEIVTIMQTTDTVWAVTHKVGSEPVLEKMHGHWCEDVKIDLADTKVSLDSAIVCMKKANIPTPKSKKCAFRKPLYKILYKSAFYIFGGTSSSFVAVDCNTGAVSSMKQIFPESKLSELEVKADTTDVKADTTATDSTIKDSVK